MERLNCKERTNKYCKKPIKPMTMEEAKAILKKYGYVFRKKKDTDPEPLLSLI